MSVQIPFPVPAHGYALNSKLRINLQFLVDQFNEFNTGTASWDTVSIGIANSEDGTLTFYNSSNANYLTFQCGATSANITYTLPATNPATTYQFLLSSSAGVMKWSSLNMPDSWTGNLLLYIDGAFTIKEVPVGVGNKILVNASPPAFYSLLGTTNQITVTGNPSDFTLSLPQDIATSSIVTFGQLITAGGSASDPGVAVVYSGASVNSGMWAPSGTQIDITVAGTTRFSVVSDGSAIATSLLQAPTLKCTTDIKMINGGASGTLTLQVPTSSFSDFTLTLPDADGSPNYVLTTDGSGTLSFQAPGSLSGTVNSGTANQFAYYATSSTAVSGQSVLTYSSTVITCNAQLDITSQDTGIALRCSQSVASNSVRWLLENISGTSGADAILSISAQSSSGGDPFVQFQVGGTPTYWSLGGDNSDSDSFKLSKSSGIGISTALTVDTSLNLTTGGLIGVPNGSASAPSYSFSGDTDTGLFWTSGSINFSINNSVCGVIDATGIAAANGKVVRTQDGTSSAPGFTFDNDTDTGIYRIGTNQLNIATGGVHLADFKNSGTSDGVDYFQFELYGGGGTNGYGFVARSTTGVSTTPTQIIGVQFDSGLCQVLGSNGAGDRFVDVILVTFDNTTPTVIALKTSAGSPASRSYTGTAGGALLAMGSGTYTIKVISYGAIFR